MKREGHIMSGISPPPVPSDDVIAYMHLVGTCSFASLHGYPDMLWPSRNGQILLFPTKSHTPHT
jgi:hypothetical protein